MDERFESALRAGTDEVAGRTVPAPAERVRARGDRLRGRRRAALAGGTAALAVAVGATAFALGAGPHDAGPAAGVTPSPAATGSPSPAPSASGTSKGKGTSPDPVVSGSHSPGAASPSGGCRSLLVPATVKSGVTTAFRATLQDVTHIEPVPGTFFYGRCGSTTYAAARFRATAGASTQELVQLQDDGSAMKYFTLPGHGTWHLVASDGFPADPRGCAAIHAVPAALAAAWDDCSVKPAGTS
jgi:hypothetical protein